jgi:hypothetical protein
MPAIIVAIRPGDQKLLERQAAEAGRPPRELAALYVEKAIRRAEAERARHAARAATDREAAS